MKKIEIEVTQIILGREYSAVITINDTVSFQGSLKLGVPIDEIDNQNFPNDETEIMEFSKNLFQFSIKKDETSIEITDEIFGFLIQVFGNTAIEFYNNKQARKTNKGISGQLLEKNSHLGRILGINMAISIKSSFHVKDIPSILKTYL